MIEIILGKKFVNKIKATKQIASERNVHNWFNCVFHSIIIIFGLGLYLSILTVVHLMDVSGDTPINELPLYVISLPILYTLLISYLFLEKLIIAQIIVYDKLNRQLFKLWHKMDMYWFKKYRKSSPLTEGMAKFQRKTAKLHQSPRKRKIVIIALIAGLILLQVGLRAPLLIEIFNNETPIEETFPEEINEKPLTPDYNIVVRGAG